MKKLVLVALIALIVGSVAYKDYTTTDITYYEAGNPELQHIVLPSGDIGTDWIREDCYLHICYEPIKINGQVLPNTASQERSTEISTGEFWGKESLLIDSKKIHIVSIS